jgi:hypothetical protein
MLPNAHAPHCGVSLKPHKNKKAPLSSISSMAAIFDGYKQEKKKDEVAAIFDGAATFGGQAKKKKKKK